VSGVVLAEIPPDSLHHLISSGKMSDHLSAGVVVKDAKPGVEVTKRFFFVTDAPDK